MQSALYTGRLEHRRHRPVAHAFRYDLTLFWLDLAEVDEVFRGRWLWSARGPAPARFRRADYLGAAAVPLAEAVRDCVERETGGRPAGPIRLLTQLRTLGVCFNPVSFYYCYDRAGECIEAIVAEITNTPWNERHAYVLRPSPADRGRVLLRFQLAKAFHVSPFMPMNVEYDWRFTLPGQRLAVHMQNREGGTRSFDATLALRRRPINGPSLAGLLARQPCAGAAVLARIYWQALRLRVKGAPFHAHPRNRQPEKLA